jgi:hypothetical protein
MILLINTPFEQFAFSHLTNVTINLRQATELDFRAVNHTQNPLLALGHLSILIYWPLSP